MLTITLEDGQKALVLVNHIVSIEQEPEGVLVLTTVNNMSFRFKATLYDTRTKIGEIMMVLSR
jgi:hypothetical protein